MSDDAFWALINLVVLVASLVGYGAVFWLNGRANRRQLERLTRKCGWPEVEA